ncbi:MAG: ATP-dependent helicase [Candidatus Limousia pullorum]
MQLSQKQLQIVNHKDGALLVEAGPGSGKTRVLIERIKCLLSSSKRGKVLALTFSNLAADEMKDRLSEDRAFEEQLDRVTAGTIHSFCLDLVQSRGNLIGLNSDMVLFESEDDRKTVLKDVFLENQNLKDFLVRQQDKNQIIQRILQLITEQKKRFVLPENCSVKDPFPLIYSEYNQKLIDQNAMDFDDILFFAYRILTENPSVVRVYNSLYRYICIDEAQDLNFAQYQVIKALCGDSFNNVMMVGDANQSIYGFNGSDSDFMTKSFVDDFSPVIYKLNDNYRSAKRIVEFANRLEHYDSVTNYVYDGELLAKKLEDESAEAKFVADKIEELIQNGHPDVEGQLSVNRMAVIARNKYVFSHLEKELSDRNIPFSFKKNSTGIDNESEYMKVFGLAIRILINRKDYIHLTQLKKVVGFSDNIADNKNGITILREVLAKTDYESMIPALEALSKEVLNFSTALNCLDNILSSFDDDERYFISMDIQQWRTHWNKYCMLVPRENRTLTSFRNQISLGKTREAEDNNGIALLTAHMSKGLQFDVVFIIGLSEGTFPDYRAIKADGSQLSQEMNNMYVAVTRAKRLCYMTYPEKKRMPWGDIKYQSPSRYIKDIVT